VAYLMAIFSERLDDSGIPRFSHRKAGLLYALFLSFLPLIDIIFAANGNFIRPVQNILIFTLLGLSLHIITGITGLLHLGIAAFMAIGSYSYAILTAQIYPFQLNGWLALIIAWLFGGAFGCFLGIPTLRLRGDYLAIVTLGFGEIVQDILKNLEVITKGTQGISPLPSPELFGISLVTGSPVLWYYTLCVMVFFITWAIANIERSPQGMSWRSVALDEIVAGCMKISVTKNKMRALFLGAALASLSGALWAASLGTSGEPSNFDFQVSIIALCIVITGGLGSLVGSVLGTALVVGFTSLFLGWLTRLLSVQGVVAGGSVYASPNNWKYFVFGLALILMIRWRPEGLLPPERKMGMGA
jgi:branched-chain amino acid transport system permease protein